MRQFSLASLILLLLFTAMVSLLFKQSGRLRVQHQKTDAQNQRIQALHQRIRTQNKTIRSLESKIASITKTNGVARLQDMLCALTAQELEQQREFGPDHPCLRETRQQIARIERALATTSPRSQ